MWRAFLHETSGNMLTDGRVSGSMVVGNNITSGTYNYTTFVTINPYLSISSGEADTYVGDNLVFTSGVNAGLSREITAVDYSGGQLRGFTVAAFPDVPVKGDTFYTQDPSVGGPGATLYVGGNFVNSPQSIVISPYETISYSAAVEDYVGKYLIFAHHANYSFGEQISEIVHNGTQLLGFKFASQFPNTPSVGDMFHLVDPEIKFVVSTLRQNIIMLGKEISNIVFESESEVGYSNCTLTLNQFASKMGRLFDTIPGMILEIVDPDGETVYTGLVYSISIDGVNATINAMSVLDVNSWIYVSDIVYPETHTELKTDGSPLDTTPRKTTTPEIIRDLLKFNPYLRMNSSGYSIDPRSFYQNIATMDTKSWTKQQNDNLLSGIGPRDWSNGDYTIADIINELLEMGFYGGRDESGNNIEGDTVVVQVYNHLVPTLRVLSRKPNVSDAKWFISSDNFKQGYEGLKLDADISDTEVAVYASYNTSDGQTLRSVTTFNINLIRKFGLKGTTFTSKEGDLGSVLNSVYATKNDKSVIGGPGSITLTGQIKGKRGHSAVPIWRIKAGDIVAFEGKIGNTFLFRSHDSTPGIFVVGSTSYDVANGTMTVTAHKPRKYRDIFNAAIKL